MSNQLLPGPSTPNTQISKITDHLYLCAARAVTDGKARDLGITCVINASLELPFFKPPVGSGIEYVKLPDQEAPTSNLAANFDAVADKVREVRRQGGSTLIHCVSGVSRSAALCMVYLVKYGGLNLREAYYHVRSRRSIIHPYAEYFQQMIQFEKKVLGKTSIVLVPNPNGDGLIPDVYEKEFQANMMREQLQPTSQQPPAIPARPYSAQRHYAPASSMDSPRLVRPRRVQFHTPSAMSNAPRHYGTPTLGGTSQQPPEIPAARPYSAQRHHAPASSMDSPRLLRPRRVRFHTPSAMANAPPHHGIPTLGGRFSPLAVSTPFLIPPPTAFMPQGPGRMAS